MERQGFHEALEEIWKVIRAANGYIDHQAPWALNKTDKARMATVLRVLVDTMRVIATLLQPFMPTVMANMLDQLGRAGARANQLAALAAPLAGRHPPCRRRAACSRAMWSRASCLMLIDSHCHLDYFTPMELPLVLARAACGRRGRDGDDRHLDGAIGKLPALAERIRISGAPSACIRTTPPRRRSRAGNAGGDDPASEGDRHRRIRPGLLLRSQPARRSGGEFPRQHPRRASGRVPLAIHARDADADIALILQQETRPGRGRSPFLLHCFSSTRALAEAAIGTGWLSSASRAS
jgi:hypothetical protein